MSIIVDTRMRQDGVEIMDDFTIQGPMLHNTLDTLANINKWLGGTSVTLHGLNKILRNYPKDNNLTLIDVGCGSGELLREVSDFGQHEGFKFNLIGVDANQNTLNYARELSYDYPNIEFIHCDIFSDEFKSMQYDIVLSTLFLHHFNENQLVQLLTLLLEKAKIGIVVNDLHRHRLAYYLFRLLCLIIPNRMVKVDGLTSVLKGFKRNELERLTRKIAGKGEIKWKWAFRYLWILRRNE